MCNYSHFLQLYTRPLVMILLIYLVVYLRITPIGKSRFYGLYTQRSPPTFFNPEQSGYSVDPRCDQAVPYLLRRLYIYDGLYVCAHLHTHHTIIHHMKNTTTIMIHLFFFLVLTSPRPSSKVEAYLHFQLFPNPPPPFFLSSFLFSS